MELQFVGISKTFGKNTVLKDITACLTEGVYGFLGPNGAGKSTLMNILTGNLFPTEGHILLNGEDIYKLGSVFRKQLGYMPQQQTLYPSFTVEQFLYYIASLRKMRKSTAKNRINWALSILSLDEMRGRPIKTLSGGMKQRLMLAQSIIDDPKILVLDEPTTGLDPKQRIAVRNIIGEIALNKIVILSTHVVSDVEYISKELLLFSSGEILRKDTAQHLESELSGNVWEIEVPENKLHKINQYGLLCGITRASGKIIARVLTPARPSLSAKAVAPTLEDVYLNYFGR